MKVSKKLKPGQPGTKKWIEKFGENLVCVRYRDDKNNGRKLITVEIIVEQNAWEIKTHRIPRNKLLYVRVDFNETYLRKLIKSAGGKWNREKQLWELPYSEILDLGLENRMIEKG